jgi:hypothetical protein
VDGNGRMLLFYNADSSLETGGHRKEINLGNMSSPSIGASSKISTDGLTGTDYAPDALINFDIAYDASRDRFVAVYEQQPYPSTYPNYISTSVQIASIDGASIWSGGGTWKVESVINPALTNIQRNHNPGIKRNQYGGLPDGNQLGIVFTKSCSRDNGASCPTAEWSYDLWEISGSLSANDIASSGFSTSQTLTPWKYQYLNGSSYTNMTWDSTEKKWKGSNQYDAVGVDWQHPGTSNDSVRAWVAPKTGNITIGSTGTIKLGSGGDGVQVKVLKNTTQIWPASGWQTINANSSVAFPSTSVAVAKGDNIRFIVNRKGTDYYDTTTWNPTVTY